LDVEELSFEEAFARLEEAVRTLERGDLALAEMVALYEEGVRLSEHCARLLDAAELRVTRLAQGAEASLEPPPVDLPGRAATSNGLAQA